MKASASTAKERDISVKTVHSPLPHLTAIGPHEPSKGKAKKEESNEDNSLSETESVPPAPKIKASKRKLTGEELMTLVKDTDNEAKDYIIQNAFMKEDF